MLFLCFITFICQVMDNIGIIVKHTNIIVLQYKIENLKHHIILTAHKGYK